MLLNTLPRLNKTIIKDSNPRHLKCRMTTTINSNSNTR